MSLSTRVLGTLILAFSFALTACESNRKESSIPESGQALRTLTPAERAADYDQLLSLFQTFYGPYRYKEARYGYNIADLAQTLKAQALAAKTDEEFAGYVMQLGAFLRDGHVQIRIENTASGISSYKIPLVITPLENRAIIADITPELANFTGLAIGDEVLTVDGKTPYELLPLIQKYKSLATDLSNQQMMAAVFSRASYMTDVLPTSPFVHIRARKANGTLISTEVAWEPQKYVKDMENVIGTSPLQMKFSWGQAGEAMDAHRAQMGRVEPIFLTPQTQQKYDFVRVYPSDAARKKFGMADTEKPAIYAALYRYQGKTIFLVRQNTYSPSDFKPDVYMKAFQALMSEYEKLADVMVLDQTHNPGGSYCADFYDLFARANDRQGVQLMRTDRKWINDMRIEWMKELPKTTPPGWDARMLEGWSVLVEKAYDRGDFLSEPIPLFTGFAYSRPRDFTWTKPMLVLADQLSGSCGDIFPMLIKANARAKIFGQQTMGLGGNVEEVGVLQNSRIHVSLTRGLYYTNLEGREPQPSDFMENNGVQPDYPYAVTVDDFRAGYVDYVKNFSDRALEQIAP